MFIARATLLAIISNMAAVATSNATAVESTVLLEKVGDTLTITATDNEVTLVAKVDAKDGEDFSTCVNAKHFAGVLKILPECPVEMDLKNNKLHVQCGPAKYLLNVSDPTMYPEAPTFEERGSMVLAGKDLKRLVSLVSFAVPVDDNRYGLNGIHVEEAVEGVVRMVSTDGSRLNLADSNYEGDLSMDSRTLLSKKSARFMGQVPEEEVTVSFGDRAVQMKWAEYTLHARLVEGEFPPYRSVIPSSWLRRMVVMRDELLVALKRVRLEAMDRAHTVTLYIDAENLVAFSRNVDTGEATHPVPINFEGEPIKVGVNVDYVIEALSAVSCEKVVFEMGEVLSPIVIKNAEPAEDDMLFLFLVMPVRLD